MPMWSATAADEAGERGLNDNFFDFQVDHFPYSMRLPAKETATEGFPPASSVVGAGGGGDGGSYDAGDK